MLKDKSRPYYIVCGYTYLRRGIDRLTGIVQQNFKLDVCSGAVFLFCGRKYDRIKALLWEGDGFLLFYERPDNERQISVVEKQDGSGTDHVRAIHMADAGTFDRAAKGDKKGKKKARYHVIKYSKNRINTLLYGTFTV